MLTATHRECQSTGAPDFELDAQRLSAQALLGSPGPAASAISIRALLFQAMGGAAQSWLQARATPP